MFINCRGWNSGSLFLCDVMLYWIRCYTRKFGCQATQVHGAMKYKSYDEMEGRRAKELKTKAERKLNRGRKKGNCSCWNEEKLKSSQQTQNELARASTACIYTVWVGPAQGSQEWLCKISTACRQTALACNQSSSSQCAQQHGQVSGIQMLVREAA